MTTPAANPPLVISQIADFYARQNFQKLQAYFASQNQLLNFNFREAIFTEAQKDFPIAHGLNAAPLDIIVTRVTGPGKVTFEYGKFDVKNVYLTVTGACRVRFFVGTYYNQQSGAANKPTDTLSYQGT